MMTKIAIFDVKDFEKNFLLEHKPENCEFILISEPIQENFDANFEKVKDAEIISIFTTSRVKNEILGQLPNLKMIATRSTGFSHIDLDYCKQHNIAVVNVPKYGDCTVAEFAFGLLLNVMRKINLAYENLQEGIINVQGYVGHDLNAKTIGIIGTGAIGAHAVKIAYGFCMKVLAFDPCPKQELVDNYGVEYVDLERLLKESDIITIHAPSTKENFHMISDDAFKKMKRGVVIVNTARGEIMDTEALYRALREGIVSGAGLDVLECEEIFTNEGEYLSKTDCINQECLSKTLINNQLLKMPNVIVTPHVAFDTIEAINRILKITIDNINVFLSGNIQNRVA